MIFISHSSDDHDAATALHARLLARDYDPSQLFLDSDADSGIAAGEPWQQTLYARLKDCRALIVLGTQNWLDSKWCFAELVYAKASGKEIFPVLLEPCDFRGVLDEHQAVFVHRDGDAAWERLWRVLDTRHLGPRDDFGWPPKDGDACPFPGLLSFDERYAGVYFGREPETQAVLEELRKMRANGEPRLLMITGGSGSGKSSLLKAGVLPQLTHKSSGTEWLVLPVMRYGQAASPQHTVFDQLAMNVAQSGWRILRDAFSGTDGAKAFVDVTRDLAVARGSPGATVLLPVDQFEELLAPAAGPDAAAFLRFLHEVFGVANGRLLAIGTMRSDHLDVYERHPHALTAPYFQPWRLGPFPRDRVRDVIVKPAARAGVEVTPDLLARLERDTPSSESLPLLAFTLEKLYRRYAADRKLDLQEYEDLGGMEGSIQKSADAIALTPDVLGAVRLTFVKHLASFNDKDEAVRVTARWSEIPDAAKPALERFVADHLLVKNDHDDEGGRWVSVEVAHEALFRAWPALKQWLDDAADILRWRRDVQRDRAADPLWRTLRPSQLAVARPWLSSHLNELTDEEVGWIRKSIRRERGRRAFAALIGTMIMGFAIYAFWQKRVADRASQVSLGRFLTSQSLDVAATSPVRSGQALLLAIEGYLRAPSAVTGSPLRTAMAATALPITRLRHDGVVAVAFSRDGRLLATRDKGNRVRVWDFMTGTELARTDLRGGVRPDFPATIAFGDRVLSPNGKLIAEFGPWSAPGLRVRDASTGEDVFSLVSNWDIETRLQRARFSVDGRHLIVCLPDSTVRVFLISPDDKILPLLRFTPQAPPLDADIDRTATFAAVAFDGGWVIVWRLEPGHSIRQFSGDVSSIASPAGGTIGLFGLDSRIIDERSGKTLLRLGEIQPHYGAVFSKDGQQFAGTDGRHRIVIADLRTRRTRLVPRDRAVAMQFSPDGTQLFVADRDGRLTALINREERLVLRTHVGTTNVFSADARFFAVDDLGRVCVYDIVRKKKLAEIRSKPLFDGLAFSPDGKFLAFIPDNTTLAIWSTELQAEVFRIPMSHATGARPIFDRGSRQIAFTNGTEVHVYDLGEKKKVATLLQIGGQVRRIAFSPDGEYLAAGSEDKNLRIWRIADGEAVMAIPQEHSFIFDGIGGSRTIQFTSDGRFLVVALRAEDARYGNFVRLVLWRPEDVVREACRRSLRKALSPAEWQQFLGGQHYRETCSEEVLKTAAH